MSVLEELKKKISDIETQSLAMDGCRPTFTVSEIMDLIDSVESGKQKAESAQNVPNGDSISRRAAIDAVKRNTFRLTFSQERNCEGHVAWSANAVYSDVIEGALLELPSEQPEKHTDERTEMHACDYISREAAIETSLEFFVEFLGGAFYENSQKELIARFQRLPSAQPKREKGKWITQEFGSWAECSECHELYDIPMAHSNFCPNCGADMRGEQDE